MYYPADVRKNARKYSYVPGYVVKGLKQGEFPLAISSLN